jgi:hypothetical protein
MTASSSIPSIRTTFISKLIAMEMKKTSTSFSGTGIEFDIINKVG